MLHNPVLYTLRGASQNELVFHVVTRRIDHMPLVLGHGRCFINAAETPSGPASRAYLGTTWLHLPAALTPP